MRSQRLAILEYARHHDVRIDEFIEATASGQASDKRRRLDELLHLLQRGDRLVVSELSRLGRSLGQIVAILDALATADVAFVALKEHIRVEGPRDIQTKVMTTLFALFAEVERDLIAERTREGLARARASGKKLGRPKGALGVSRLDGKEDDIRRFLELGVSKTAIAKITGVSRTSLYSFMRTRGLKPSPSRVWRHESCRYPYLTADTLRGEACALCMAVWALSVYPSPLHVVRVRRPRVVYVKLCHGRFMAEAVIGEAAVRSACFCSFRNSMFTSR